METFSLSKKRRSAHAARELLDIHAAISRFRFALDKRNKTI